MVYRLEESFGKEHKFIFGQKEYKMLLPEVDKTKWYVIKDQLYRPDRDKFIVTKYNELFRDNPVDNVSLVYKLASRSKLIGSYLAAWNAEYVSQEKVPQFFKDTLSPQEFSDLTELQDKFSAKSAAKGRDIKEKADIFKRDLQQIEEKYAKEFSELSTSPELKILQLTQQDLPLSLVMLIEKYTAQDKISPLTAREYAREMLVRYKQILLKWAKENPEKEVMKIINETRSK